MPDLASRQISQASAPASLATPSASAANKIKEAPSSTPKLAVAAEIRVPSQPILLTVDAPTDYVAAVATPVVVALAAVLIAWLNQRNAIRSTEALQKLQLRSSTANFRQAWSTDFRTFCAEYVATVTQLYFRKLDEPNFLASSEATDLHTRKITARAAIRMMLDNSKPYTGEILAIMDNVEDALWNDASTPEVSPMPDLSKFVDKAQEVREVAWNDIKKDLHHS